MADSYRWLAEKKKEAMLAKMQARGLPDYRQLPISERYGVSYTGLGTNGQLDRNAPVGVDHNGGTYHEGEYKANLPEGNVYINSDISKMMNPPTGQDQMEASLYAQKGNLPSFQCGGYNKSFATGGFSMPNINFSIPKIKPWSSGINNKPPATNPTSSTTLLGGQRTPGQSPNDIQANAPGKTTGISPNDIQTLAPGRTIGLSPNDIQAIAPGKTTGLSPNDIEQQSPAAKAAALGGQRTPGLSPGDIQANAPGKTTGLSPNDIQTLAPGRTIGLSPNDLQANTPGYKGVTADQVTALNTKNAAEVAAAGQQGANQGTTTTGTGNVGRDYLANSLDPNNPLYNSEGGVAARELSLKQQQERSALAQNLAQQGITGDRASVQMQMLQATQEGQANDLAAQYGIAGMKARQEAAGKLMNFDEDKRTYETDQNWKGYEAALNAGDFETAGNLYNKITGKTLSLDQLKLAQGQQNTITGLNIQNLQTSTGVASASAVSNLLGQGFSVDAVNSQLGTHITAADALAIYNNTPAGERDFNRNLGMAQTLLSDPNTATQGVAMLKNLFPGSGIDFSGMITSANAKQFSTGLANMSDYVASGMDWSTIETTIGKDGTLAALGLPNTPEGLVQAQHIYEGMKVNTIDQNWNQITSSNWYKSLPPDQQADQAAFFSAVQSGSLDYTVQHAVTKADGSTQWFNSSKEAKDYVTANPTATLSDQVRVSGVSNTGTGNTGTGNTGTDKPWVVKDKNGITIGSYATQADANAAATGNPDYAIYDSTKPLTNNVTFSKFVTDTNTSVDVNNGGTVNGVQVTPLLYTEWLRQEPTTERTWANYKAWSDKKTADNVANGVAPTGESFYIEAMPTSVVSSGANNDIFKLTDFQAYDILNKAVLNAAYVPEVKDANGVVTQEGHFTGIPDGTEPNVIDRIYSLAEPGKDESAYNSFTGTGSAWNNNLGKLVYVKDINRWIVPLGARLTTGSDVEYTFYDPKLNKKVTTHGWSSDGTPSVERTLPSL